MKDFLEIVEKVETRREFLKTSSEIVLVVDYGAGKPEDKRTKVEMEKGVLQEVSLKNLASIGVKREKAKVIFDIFSEIQPRKILELGTCCGFSSSYMSFFAKNADIITLEGSPNVVKIARENHEFFRIKNVQVVEGRFDLTLPGILCENKFDFAFIDGHHNKDATIGYFKEILPSMNKGAVMLFDDILWSEGMQEAWSFIVDSKMHKKCEEKERMGLLWL